MIDIEKIKAIPDDKPRKGPARMSKSEKSPAQEKWKKYCSRLRQYRSEWLGDALFFYDPHIPVRSTNDRLRVAREVEQILIDIEESLDP